MSEPESNSSDVETPENALNALCTLLEDILPELTVVELFANPGRVSQRFLQSGASQAVCVNDSPPEDKIEDDGIIWLPMDPIDFLGEERVRDVGLVYSNPPYGTRLNESVLDKLPECNILVDNCIVIIEEATWKQTRIQDYAEYEVIEESTYDQTRIVVTQMREEPQEG
ncbi:MAG: RsmD family RNA methyltransferase [bacterium]